jgi:hypothetical protein
VRREILPLRWRSLRMTPCSFRPPPIHRPRRPDRSARLIAGPGRLVSVLRTNDALSTRHPALTGRALGHGALRAPVALATRRGWFGAAQRAGWPRGPAVRPATQWPEKNGSVPKAHVASLCRQQPLVILRSLQSLRMTPCSFWPAALPPCRPAALPPCRPAASWYPHSFGGASTPENTSTWSGSRAPRI